MNELLRISDLRVTYLGSGRSYPAVRGVDLRVGQGETVALVGESGSGKTSIGRSILGLHGRRVHQQGSISLAGEELLNLSQTRWRALRGIRVSLVPQDPLAGLNPVQPIGRQVAEVLVRHGRARGRTARNRAEEALEQAGLEEAGRRYRAYPHELSGGQRQRVLIAIATVAAPELIIADEPTSSLDVTVQKRILDQLELLTAGSGTSVLLITHDLGLAADRADRVAVLESGRVVDEVPGGELFRAASSPAARSLVSAVPTFDSPVLIGASGPEPASAAGPESGIDVAPPIVTARQVRVVFPGRGGRGDVTALDQANLTVAAGESVGIVGESGSGKSTLARVILGLQRPTAGQAMVGGIDAAAHLSRAGRRELRRIVQPVFQDPYSSFDPRHSIGASIAEPLAALTPMRRRDRAQRILDLLDQVRLPAALARRRPNELSGGQLQRAAIARALAVSPRVVVADEAVSALDVAVQDQVLQLLARLQREQGLSLVFISHDLAVVRQISHRVLVMRRAEVIEEGPTAKVLAAPTTAYTRGLIEAVPGRALTGSTV